MARVMAEPPRVRAVDEQDLPIVRRFLEQHADTSMFLLSSLATNGPRMGEALNSGDFKLIEHDGDVRAVFCLTRRTPILAQACGRTEYARAIVEACLQEPGPIGGVLGEWPLADAIWSILRERPSFKEIYACKEILQARDLTEADASRDATPHVRPLRPQDFDQWDALNHAFAQQEGLPRHGTPAERKSLFEDATRAGRWWGYFEDDRLSSTAGLNALYKHIGQVGGVYTVPEKRGLGFSTTTMMTLMADSVRVHGLRRLVLFTGDHNRAARRVYDRLGFATIGDFALLMCEPIE